MLSSGQLLRRSAAFEATELIREAIRTGRLLPGQRLKEEQLARDLGISRTPVREALHMLSGDGIIELVANRGAVVRSYDIDELDKIYRVRALLEGYAVRCATEHLAEDVVLELWAGCARFDALVPGDDVHGLVDENVRFHNLILAAAANEHLERIVVGITDLPLVYKSYIWISQEQKETAADFHRRITRAVEQRDASRAEMLMTEHILSARDLLLAQLRELEERAASQS